LKRWQESLPINEVVVFTGAHFSKKYLKKPDQPPQQPTKNCKTGVLVALIVECIQTAGVARLSYLIGDDSEGVAAVFDPRADVDCYLLLAREKQVSITHIFETHIHVDFVSGARELCVRVESAKIYLSQQGGAQYGFDHERIADGDNFVLGSALIAARHTPGHTPEHRAYLLAEEDHAGIPWGVLTGDSLFVGSAGRFDLLGRRREKKLEKEVRK
jgi:hydroxyacylglutathione hydrolase